MAEAVGAVCWGPKYTNRHKFGIWYILKGRSKTSFQKEIINNVKLNLSLFYGKQATLKSGTEMIHIELESAF